MTPDLVLFDCDGVLVDSEPITNALLVKDLGRHGLPKHRWSAGSSGCWMRWTRRGSLMRSARMAAWQRCGLHWDSIQGFGRGFRGGFFRHMCMASRNQIRRFI